MVTAGFEEIICGGMFGVLHFACRVAESTSLGTYQHIIKNISQTFYLLVLYVWVLFSAVLSAHRVHTVSMETRKGYQMPWDWSL